MFTSKCTAEYNEFATRTILKKEGAEMTVIKKAVCILMTATLAFGSLAGCGKNTKGAVNTKYEKTKT